MDQVQKKQWEDRPDETHDVVIVLRTDVDDASSEMLGVENLEPIRYQPGMFKARMTGAELLRLAELPEVEDIGPDDEVRAL
jgi:hypothetical protein